MRQPLPKGALHFGRGLVKSGKHPFLNLPGQAFRSIAAQQPAATAFVETRLEWEGGNGVAICSEMRVSSRLRDP